MSITVYEHMEQGTKEWLQARLGIVTASTVGKLITPTLKPAANKTSRDLALALTGERLTGRPTETPVTRAMERGTLDEPFAREAYANHSGVEVKEVGFITKHLTKDAVLGYSPDGLVGDDGLIEIKSRDPKKHLETIMADEVPAENMAQIQAGLLVSGRAWCDYVSYSGGLKLWVKRVHPHPDWFDALHNTTTAMETQIHLLKTRYETATKHLPQTEYIDHFEDLELKL